MAELSQLEADEAFARQLQAEEAGQGGGGGYIQIGPVRIQQSPTQRQGQRQRQAGGAANANSEPENPTVLNARLNQLSTARATVAAIVIIHIPQVIAAIVILMQHWNSTAHCDDLHRNRWKWWALINSVRMLAYTSCVCYMHVYKDWLHLPENHSALHRATNIRNITDATGLVWFVVGNMWIFGDNTCHHQMDSPVYNLCLSMLIISYVQICLPCILAAMLIPIFCFCMPCLIRVLARVQENANKGATEELIEALPTTTLTEDSDLIKEGGDNTCPICLSDMVVGEKVRILHCKHFFHNTCVDEWLKVNASCPTCRESILTPRDEESGGMSRSGAVATSSSSTSISSDSSNRNSNSNSRRVLLSQQEEEDDEEERKSDENSYINGDIESTPLCP